MKRQIETDRLILRTVTVDDAEAVYKWASDSDVNKYMIYPLHKNVDFTKKWLESREIDGDDEFDLGFVPEAIKAIIDYVDKEKGIRMIYGEFAKENSKSKRVMEKLGMTYWKDCRFTKLDGSVIYDAYLYKREF